MPRSKFERVPIPTDGAGEPVTVMPACENCHAPAEAFIVHLREGNTEWFCYPCHVTQMAGVLTEMALAEANETAATATVSAYPDKLELNRQYGAFTP